MTIFAHIALLGWLPLTLLMFMVMPARRAAAASIIGGVLFLPMSGYDLPHLPDYTKQTAASVAVVFATALFESRLIVRFRLSWIDVPMLTWCLVPIATSLSNGLGIWDGISASAGASLTWGAPFFIGRLYFRDAAGLRELATMILIGGLLYVPLCLFEVRFSPQLHQWIYGWHQNDFGQTRRLGGWRPTVFMQHGLMVAMWMTACSMVGLWLWIAEPRRRIYGFGLMVLVPTLVVTTLLCKSVGAIALLVLGLGSLVAARWFKTSLVALAVLCFPLLYMPTRALNLWTGEELTDVMSVAGDVASGSLQFRLENERRLADKALEQPLVGWGGWGRLEVYDEFGRPMAVPDGLWVIALGCNGIIGLLGLTGSLLLPALIVVRRIPPRQWGTPAAAPLVALAMVLGLSMIDNLFNAMVNPAFTMAAGALASVCVARRPAPARAAAAPAGGGVLPAMGFRR